MHQEVGFLMRSIEVIRLQESNCDKCNFQRAKNKAFRKPRNLVNRFSNLQSKSYDDLISAQNLFKEDCKYPKVKYWNKHKLAKEYVLFVIF